MQSPVSDTNIPFSPVQSPPPPPPLPPTPTTLTGTPHRTTISFGNAEPPRHMYDNLSDALTTVHDNSPLDSEPATAAAVQIRSRQDSRGARPPPRRLSILTQSSRSAPRWLPKTPLYAPPLTPLHSLLSPSYPFLVRDEKYYTSWEVQYSFSAQESKVHGSFALVVFLGPPILPETGMGVEEWIACLEATGCRIGGHGVSAGAVEGQGDELGVLVEGTIPLTKALIERIDEMGGRLDAERVLPYLRQKLHYVAERADGGIVTLGILEVKIVSSVVDIEEPGSRSDYKSFDTVYGEGIGRVR